MFHALISVASSHPHVWAFPIRFWHHAGSWGRRPADILLCGGRAYIIG